MSASAKTLSVYHFVSVHLFKRENPLDPDGFEASIAAAVHVSLAIIDNNTLR